MTVWFGTKKYSAPTMSLRTPTTLSTDASNSELASLLLMAAMTLSQTHVGTSLAFP